MLQSVIFYFAYSATLNRQAFEMQNLTYFLKHQTYRIIRLCWFLFWAKYVSSLFTPSVSPTLTF